MTSVGRAVEAGAQFKKNRQLLAKLGWDEVLFFRSFDWSFGVKSKERLKRRNSPGGASDHAQSHGLMPQGRSEASARITVRGSKDGPVRSFVCASWSVLRGAPSALLGTRGLGVRKLRESAAKLLKSFVGVNLCAGRVRRDGRKPHGGTAITCRSSGRDEQT